MKEHKTSSPIIAHLLKGELIFGVNGSQQHLKQVNIIALAGSITHNLTATKDSIVSLSLSKIV